MPASNLTEPAPDYAAQRRTMVDCQIRTFDVTDHAVIARFLDVPREAFLPPELAPFAYSDMALKLPMGQAGWHLLPPAILARLIQAAGIRPTDKILDVGSGNGYSAAILAGLAPDVVALESDAARCDAVKANLARADVTTVRVLNGPLADGAAAEAPFDVIVIDGGVEAQLDRLLQQLRTGGRLLTIVRKTTAPGYGASHAVCFESQAGRISSSMLFDADAVVLPEFHKAAEFVF
ncbi:MAG: protein-L-isoaspartate O-methyltransferase family protein [Methylovirgula sp.]